MQQEKKTRFLETPKKAQRHSGPSRHQDHMSPRSQEERHRSTKSTSNIHNHDRASHTSVYFTPEPDSPANDKLSSKNRRKQKTRRIGIHIARNTHNPKADITIPKTPNYTRKGPQYYDPLTHSDRRSQSSDSNSSDNESGDLARRKIIFYDPVKRSCSQESAGRYASQFKQRLAEDKKVEMKASMLKSPRKSSPARKKVYRPIDTKDTCLQTEGHTSNINKECQVESENVRKCCRGDQCDLLKDYVKESHRTVGVGCDHHEHKQRTQYNNSHDTGHIFPFTGKSSSGTLQVPSQMVSFESKNISVLVANPKKTRIRHKEFHDMRSTEGPDSDELFEPVRKNHHHQPQYNENAQAKANAATRPEARHHNPERTDCISKNKPHHNHDESKSRNHSVPKAQCHREHSGRPRKKEIGRNYTEEMRAWMDSRPFFKFDEPTDPSKLNIKRSDKDKIEDDFPRTGRNSLKHGNVENMSRILGGSGGGPSKLGLFADKRIPPPEVPPFPRETSPGASSFITQSRAFTSDTDGESSYQTSNPKKVKIKNSRGTVDFMENLHYRVKRAIHPDTKVIIGNKQFPIHSVALQIHSKYFDNLKRPYEAVHMVELPESVISPDDFQHVMDWVLTDENDRKLVITRDNVVGMYSTAQYLMIPELKAQCLKFVQEKVESEDPKLIKLWEEANLRPKTKELISILSVKLTTLFPKLYKTKQFLKLDVNELVTLLDSVDVVIDSEMDIFDAAIRWLLYDWQNRKRHTIKVMSTIRFGLLTPLQLTQMRYLAEDDEAPDFKKIFGFECVKKLLEEGLTYAILKQSYGKKAGELNKWIRNTGVVPPKARIHLDTETENQQRSPDLHIDTKTADMKQAAKEVLSQLKTLDLMSLNKNIRDTLEKAADKIAGVSENEIKADNDKELLKDKYDSPAQQSLLLLPDIPYTENPSSQTIEQDDSGEILDAEQKHNEIQAAITIQSTFRGHLARKKVDKMKEVATRLQKSIAAVSGFESKRSLKKPSKSRKSITTPEMNSSDPYMIKNLDVPKDALLVFGGADPKLQIGPDNTGRDIYMYTVEANVWMHVGRMPEPRTHFGLARIDNDVYIVGGTDPRYKTTNDRNVAVQDVWKSNLRQGEWEYDSDSPMDLSNPRSHFGCVEMDGIIYVIGGNDADSKALSTCEKYDKTYNDWTPIAPLDGPRLSMGICIYEDRIWVAGGLSKNIKMPVLKSVVCYDVTADSWMAIRPLPLPRAFLSLVYIQDSLYIVGGAGQKEKKSPKQASLQDVLLFDTGNQKWREIGVLNTARHGHVAAAIGQNIIVLGGVNSALNGAINTVEIFELGTLNSRKGRSLKQKMSGMGVLPLN